MNQEEKMQLNSQQQEIRNQKLHTMPLKDKIKFIQRRKIVDHRGWFYKVMDGREEGLPPFTGEIYVTMGKPGECKGGHYHNLANEWFSLLEGSCLVQLTDITSDEKMEFVFNSNEACTVFVPSGVAHNFKNISDRNFMLLAYTDRLYEPEDTIMWNF